MATPPPTYFSPSFQNTGNCFYGDQCNFLHVAPPGNNASISAPSLPGAPSVSKNTKLCRNVLLYGFCKFAGKGCEYNHEVSGKQSLPVPELSLFKDKEPPAVVGTQGSREARDAHASFSHEVARPEIAHGPVLPRMPSEPVFPFAKVTAGAPLYTLRHHRSLVHTHACSFVAPAGLAAKQPMPKSPSPSHEAASVRTYAPDLTASPTVLIYNQMAPLPHVGRPTTPGRKHIQAFFINDTLRQDLLKRIALSVPNAQVYACTDRINPDLPLQIHRYHSISLLEESAAADQPPKLFPVPSSVYKAVSTVDGMMYCMRQLEGYKPPFDLREILGVLEPWLRTVRHPCICTLREVFLSKELPDHSSLFLCYDFFPGAVTLEAKYLNQPGNLIPENVLWSFALQLLAALRVIHAAGMACRTIHTSKIILTGKNRIRISSVGILDLLQKHEPLTVQNSQREDFVALARVLLSLACRSPVSDDNWETSLDGIAGNYSAECRALLDFLFKQAVSVEQLMPKVGARAFMETDNLHSYVDFLEGELTKEIENGRIFRILAKLGFINERPEYELDPAWSEAGDKYLLKLFRDYLFHQVSEDGTPAVDLAHVIETLNKLDIDSQEKIMLMSRDEQTILVVTYAEVRRSIEAAFQDLLQKVPSKIAK